MEEFGIEVTGIEETVRALTEAPRAALATALVKGAKAAGDVMEQEIGSRTPVREGGLKDDLGTEIEVSSDGTGVIARTGFGARQASKAGWVEYGHRMIGHKPQKKDLGSVQPHPFMRPAAEAGADRAVEAFSDAALDELQREEIVDAA